MKRVLSIGLAGCLFTSVAMAQQQSGVSAAPKAESEMGWYGPPLVMIHGFISSPETWNVLSASMSNDGWRILKPEIDGRGRVSDNTVTMNNFFYANGMGSNTVLLGHSMGGIIARSASRQNAVTGVVTIGTPHLGAPVATAINPNWNNPFLQTQYELWYLREQLNSIPDNPWEWANEDIGPNEIEDARNRGYNAWDNLFYLTGAGVAASIGRLIGIASDAAEDMEPGSGAMSLLNSSAWAENGEIKQAYYANLQNGGLLGHAMTLLPWLTEQEADNYGAQMIYDGQMTFYAGWGLQRAGQWSGNWDMIYAGSAIMSLGDAETFFWQWWAGTIIGSWENDGFIPAWSQTAWGNRSAEYVGSMVHTRETSQGAPFLRSRINALFGH